MTTGAWRYQKVLWHHDLPDEPVTLYSEISSGYEKPQGRNIPRRPPAGRKD
ncbi:MAG TPA: hypothetical protein VLM11_13710 [Streptosporangiaceae bacterium]|nr:hypothetical protein [Streptosporangiaceae bacterium]